MTKNTQRSCDHISHEEKHVTSKVKGKAKAKAKAKAKSKVKSMVTTDTKCQCLVSTLYNLFVMQPIQSKLMIKDLEEIINNFFTQKTLLKYNSKFETSSNQIWKFVNKTAKCNSNNRHELLIFDNIKNNIQLHFHAKKKNKDRMWEMYVGNIKSPRQSVSNKNSINQKDMSNMLKMLKRYTGLIECLNN